MNEQRAFTVVVSGCWSCPFRHHDMCYHADTNKKPKSKCEDTFYQNQNAITPTCPMWNEAKPIGELK